MIYPRFITTFILVGFPLVAQQPGSAWEFEHPPHRHTRLTPPKVTPNALDKGLLDPSWFGRDITFKTDVKDIDYCYVKPGFSLLGKTIFLAPWEDHHMIEEKPAACHAKAEEVSEAFPTLLRGALMGAFDKDKVRLSRRGTEKYDILCVGRVVDCNTGSRGEKALIGFGAGMESLTWDMKMVDSSGELLLGIHHRVVGRSATRGGHLDPLVLSGIA